jgi:hypothetical protein
MSSSVPVLTLGSISFSLVLDFKELPRILSVMISRRVIIQSIVVDSSHCQT